ncbi:ribosomal RNA large subunit methyltransferase E [Alphaproteobacteria bacterium]|nr:ribosomal RNA large subunit methyltransferase E [Alphaproteobacteria bacterium]
MKITGKMSLSSRRWLDRQNSDPYVKKAHNEGYRSRAVYKLIEIDDKFHLIRNAKSIIDLGAAPGGWSQLLVQRSSEGTNIVATDLLHFHPIDGLVQVIGDFEDEAVQSEIMSYTDGKADLIVSDMAPSTIGHPQTDHLRIMRLVESTYYFAQSALANGGNFVAKIFQGGEEKKLMDSARKDFQKVCFFKPKSSRKMSSEIYIVALGHRCQRHWHLIKTAPVVQSLK